MTITVANTTLTNTFEYLVNRTSELADAMTNKVVTTDSNTTPGNAVITGTFSANVYIVGNSASNTSISAPNTEQKSSGSYFLNANGSWSSIVANNGIIANSSGIFVNANTGIVVNTAGVFVNSNYIGTLTGTSTSNNATHLGGVLAASYVQNTDSRTLSGNLAFSGANVNFTSNRVGVGNAEIRYVSSPNAMIFASDGTTERMRIDSAGNLLVGNTTSRGSRFEVERTDSDNAIADFKTNNAAGDVTIRSSGGVVRVRAQGTNDMALMTSTTVRMLIAANSNVGIANTAPAQTLTVDGTIGGTIVATQGQAEDGLVNTLVMTPLRTKQAITQNIATKANIASPVFTGNISTPSLILNGTTVTATAAELNKLNGVTATTAELNKLNGVTATTAELNILDGVTATASELNKLDGVTTSAAELNFVDGVTSAIQTQLNTKAPLASPSFTGTVATSSLNLGGNIVTDVATQAQAEAGSVHTVLMTPLRTAQAITSQVLTATAGGTFGAVGTYALLGNPLSGTGGTAISAGEAVSGSILGRASVFDELGNDYMAMVVTNSAIGGTWRLMGGGFSSNRDRSLGIFLRIA